MSWRADAQQIDADYTSPGELQQQAGGATAQLRRFVLSLGECEFAISGVLDELQRDAFTTVADHRPARCTGTALQVPHKYLRKPCWMWRRQPAVELHLRQMHSAPLLTRFTLTKQPSTYRRIWASGPDLITGCGGAHRRGIAEGQLCGAHYAVCRRSND